MAKLITCKTCGNQISDKATSCPYCGHTYVRSFYQDYRRRQWGCLWIFLAALLVIGLYVIFQR